MNNNYDNPFGVWEVTTEGDCEGRTVRNLGTHEGFLDEIAFKLADKCFYSLRFCKTEKLDDAPKKASKVSVSLDIDSGTWDMSRQKQVDFFKKMLRDRDVSVEAGTYFASVTLYDGSSPEEVARRERELERERALAKLTDRDREVLGV